MRKAGSKDAAQPLHWGPQPPLDLFPQGRWESQLSQGVFQSLQIALGSPLRALEPRASLVRRRCVALSSRGGVGVIAAMGPS
jgi:hypothetical protein